MLRTVTVEELQEKLSRLPRSAQVLLTDFGLNQGLALYAGGQRILSQNNTETAGNTVSGVFDETL